MHIPNDHRGSGSKTMPPHNLLPSILGDNFKIVCLHEPWLQRYEPLTSGISDFVLEINCFLHLVHRIYGMF